MTRYSSQMACFEDESLFHLTSVVVPSAPLFDHRGEGDGTLRTTLCAGAAALLAVSIPARADAPPASGGYRLDAGFLQLMGEGSSGAPAGVTHDLTAPGATEFDYADGSRLVIKTTEYSRGSVSVVGLIGNGRLGLSKSLAGLSWATAFLPLGGTPWASYEQIEHWLNASGHAVQLNFVPKTRAFQFDGTSSTSDLGYQIALLCGLARHPAVSDVVLRKAAEFGSTLNAQINSNPGLVFSRGVQRAVTGLGARYSELPVKDEIDVVRVDALERIVKTGVAGPIDMAVVGDLDVAAAEAVFRGRCLQSGVVGPPRVSLPLHASFARGKHAWSFVRVDNKGPAGAKGIFWSTAVYGRSDRHRIALDLLAEVLKVRVSVDRSKPGARVVPVVSALQGYPRDSFGYFGLGLESDAFPLGGIEPLVRHELDRLAHDPHLDGEVKAVLDARAASMHAAMVSNSKWAETLAESLTEPAALDRLLVSSPPDMRTAVEDTRNAALWLLQENVIALVEVNPRA